MDDFKEGFVTTFDGSTAKRKNCKYIKGNFYEMGIQCFNIEGRWYRINSGYIVFDHEKETYVIKNSTLIKGIVGIENSDWKFGFFSENISKNVMVSIGPSEIIALSEEVVRKKDFIEIQYGTKDVFISKEDKIEKFLHLPEVKPYKSEGGLDYGAKDLIETATEHYNTFYFPHKKPQEYSPYISPIESKRILGTFGIEFESQAGRVPYRFLYRLGLMPLRDGSIAGDEYATIPFMGCFEHMKTLEDIMDVMYSHLIIDSENSLHIHVKVNDFSKKFFISSFIVNSMLESEIFSLFPAFYSQTSRFKKSGKDYNNPLPVISSQLSNTNPISSVFPLLYKEFSGGVGFEDPYIKERTDRPHPGDTSGQRKWQIPQRYSWINFIPLLFGGSNTIEYRIHPPTLNFHKVLAWVYITNAILHYSVLCMDEICDPKGNILEYLSQHNIELRSIIEAIYPENSSSRDLCFSYLEYRKTLRRSLDKLGDGAGNWELKHDNEFVPHKTFLGNSTR